eukprot:6193006-Pleurochrysis_carterae.AAC.2
MIRTHGSEHLRKRRTNGKGIRPDCHLDSSCCTEIGLERQPARAIKTCNVVDLNHVYDVIAEQTYPACAALGRNSCTYHVPVLQTTVTASQYRCARIDRWCLCQQQLAARISQHLRHMLSCIKPILK